MAVAADREQAKEDKQLGGEVEEGGGAVAEEGEEGRLGEPAVV